ncbi:uncharacterized protein [Channa argus]|uniref:uncharacterized protein isoform X1 n=1 Tax=Channa argus TaxID=215402 RepID=UPI00351FBE84
MLLAEAGCLFMGFILYITGAQGQHKTACALKGSTVHFSCSAERPTLKLKWFTVNRNGSKFVMRELFKDRRPTSHMSEDGDFTLTINDLRQSDAMFYCCSENEDNPEKCWKSATKLQVSDLQVKGIPATEGHAVKLICSTRCALTETPAAYIWYKNREFLYEDWSPWYQELVRSEKGVTYSCTIKGHQGLRAPDVSVDSVTPTCFTVTYAKGRMCSNKQKSENESCSITYPREVKVKMANRQQGHVTLTCETSCPLTDRQTVFTWYKNRHSEKDPLSPIPISSIDIFSCALKDNKDLRSAEVCVEKNTCLSVNYVPRRVCALQGFSVNISSEYSHPKHQQPKSKVWYKKSGNVEAERLTEAAGRVKYHDNMNNQHILELERLTKKDSARYSFRVLTDENHENETHFPGVTLVVTGLRVTFTPSAVVSEGQRVTLTCSTSCPLSEKINFIWKFNSESLTLPQNQSKHVPLGQVGSQHAGRYSCSVKISQRTISSSEMTLTVHSVKRQQILTGGGVVAVPLVVIFLTVFLWIRRKKNHEVETSDNMEQPNPGPVYDDGSAQPVNEDDLQYSEVHFSKKNPKSPLYSTIQQDNPHEEDHTSYAVVQFRPKATPS